jgi:hypothetical protein
MGTLTRPEVDAALDRAAHKGLRLGDELVKSGTISDDVRKQALLKQSSEIM